MKFDVRLPDSPAVWMIRAAGIHADRLADVWNDLASFDRGRLPAKFSGEYFRTENPVKVELTVLAFEPHAHIQVETASQHIGRKIREKLARYSVEMQGEDVAEREHRELWGRIDDILGRDGLSYDQFESREGVLTRRAIEGLAELCEQTDPIHWKNIYKLFTKDAVPRADRAFAAGWLIKLFKREKDPHEEIGLLIGDLAGREMIDELIPLIKERGYGERRWPLCLALIKMKHPDAADVLASVLGQGLNTRFIIETLGNLKANWQAGKIRRFLADPNPDVRAEAAQALGKLGLSIEPPPPPVHLANRRDMPRSLGEWSAKLGIEKLAAALEGLTMHIEKGFDAPEIAEVAGVAREIKPGQSKTFCFRIVLGLKRSELWLVLFIDDANAVTVEIHGRADLISYFESTTSFGRTNGKNAPR